MPSVLQAASAGFLIICILEYELDLNGTGQDSHVANLSVQKPVPPRLDCRDEDDGEDAEHE